MNITADQLRAWVNKLDSLQNDLLVTRCKDREAREHLDLVNRDLQIIEDEVMERYRDAVIIEAEPTFLPFRVVSVPQGSKLVCPSGVVGRFTPDVAGAYILSTVPGPARPSR